ncbi:MAG: Rieske (2Fe-2S) protein [Thermogutta sp.]|nr:Rieske (2Fe-2S) protein [Thermogutta sp.]
MALVPGIGSGLAAFLSPLGKKAQGGVRVRLTSLDNLPDDGTPRKFPVVAEKVDAWRVSREPVGAVYLRKIAADQVQALHVVCPHAGCSVEYKPGEGDAEGRFFCPCHSANFSLSGKRSDAVSPSPRDMDSLQAEIAENGDVWVVFQNFQVGTAAKIAIA